MKQTKLILQGLLIVTLISLISFGGNLLANERSEKHFKGSIQVKRGINYTRLAKISILDVNRTIINKNPKSTSLKIQQQMASNSSEKPVPPKKNPIGDIPDNQAFVKYASLQGGYELVVPEGWARTTNGMNVTFIDKLDGVSANITSSAKRLDIRSIRTTQVEKLKKTGRAVVIKSIKDVRLASGPAILMVYESNSEPNPVTNKQVRLENNTYFYYKNGKLAKLRLWAPVGADNVDQWNKISNSFRWR